MALAETFFGLAHFGPLPMAHTERNLFDRSSEHRQGEEHFGVAIARHDLGRDRLGAQTERAQRCRFDRWIEIAVHTNGTGDLADRDGIHGLQHPRPRAQQLCVPASKRQACGYRLGVDAVRATDHRGLGVFACALGQGVSELIDAKQDRLEGTTGLQRERRVEHVR